MVDKYPERNKVGLCCTFLTRFERTLGWFVDSIGVWLGLFLKGNCDFGFSTSGFGRETGGSPSRLFNLHVLLCSNKDVPHIGDVVLHQMLVE